MTLAIQSYKDPTYRYSRKLYHYETDADGICHHSNYFRIAEESLLNFFELSNIQLDHSSISLIVSKAEATFKEPIYFNELFYVQVNIVSVLFSRFEARCQVIGQRENLLAEIYYQMATLDKTRGKPIPLPQETRRKLLSLVDQGSG